MTDFETRLRETLHEHADAAESTSELAAGARGRLRRRRRTTIAGAGVLAGAVIVAPFLINHGDAPGRGTDQMATVPPSPSPTAIESPADGLGADAVRADGLRTESWHDLTFEVPSSWGLGNPSAHCTGGATAQDATPTIGRPTDVTPRIACNPTNGYGVGVGPADLYESASGDVYQYSADGLDRPRYPGGTWVSTWYDDEVAITVATPDRALTEKIVGSVKRIDGVDANGCAPTLGEAEAGVSDGAESMSVCRYDSGDGLEWSRRLSDAGRTALDDAIQAAPTRTVDDDCPSEEGLTHTALLDAGAYFATVVAGGSCAGNNGVFLSGDVREVTPELSAALERPTPAG